MADEYGNVVHLGERECSIQRRHQKLIEEWLSQSSIDGRVASFRRQPRGPNERCRRLVISSVGTLEFLVDEKNQSFTSWK